MGQNFLFVEPIAAKEGGRVKIPILRTCDFVTKRYGRIKKTISDLKEMAENFARARGKRDIPFDYDHGTAGSSPRFTPESAIASGWLHGLEVADEGNGAGSLLADVEFTARALGFIKNKEYKYVSAEWAENYENDQTGEKGQALQAVALTNRPVMKGLPPVVVCSEGLSEQLIDEYRSAGITADASDGGVITLSNEKTNEEKPMKGLFKHLGLPEDATEEQVLKALSDRESAQKKEQEARLAKLEEENKTLSERLPNKDAVVIKAAEYEVLKADAKSGKDASIKLAERDRDSFLIRAVVDERRLSKAAAEGLKKLWDLSDDGKAIREYVATLPEGSVALAEGELGTPGGEGPTGIAAKIRLGVQKIMDDNKALSETEAQEAYFNQNPSDHEAYRKAVSVRN